MVVELAPLLVEAPLHLAQVRLEVGARLLELPDEALQLRLGLGGGGGGHSIHFFAHLLYFTRGYWHDFYSINRS